MHANVHAVLQGPLVIVVMMSGLIMLYRARQTVLGNPVDRSPALQMCMGLMLVVLALKQMFWHVFWVLRATDLFKAVEPLLSMAWIATTLNAVAIVLGTCVCVFAGKPILGVYSTSVVVGTVVAVAASSAVVVMR